MARSPPIKSTPGFSKAAPTARRWSRPRAAQNGNRFPLVLNLPECWQLKGRRPRHFQRTFSPATTTSRSAVAAVAAGGCLKKKFGSFFAGRVCLRRVNFEFCCWGKSPLLGFCFFLAVSFFAGPFLGGCFHFFFL